MTTPVPTHYSFLRKLVRPAKGLFEPPSPLHISWIERRRLGLLPAESGAATVLLGKRFEFNHRLWYLFTHREIMMDEIYRFSCASPNPLIIDCGANIGLSVIYFKHQSPNARIIAFEADPNIFQLLRKNIDTFRFNDTTLYQAAVWHRNGEVMFCCDGGVGGQVADGRTTRALTTVPAIRLKDFLDQDIALLKIDIEGGELPVLSDCRDQLTRVARIFLEYHSIPDQPQCLQELLLILRDAGFRYHIKDANPIKHPFLAEERRKVFDLQLNIFAYRS